MTRAPTFLVATTLLFPLAAGVRPAPAAPKEDEKPPALRPTLREIFEPPTLLGRRPRLLGVSADGRFVLYSWAEKDEEKPKSTYFVVSKDGGEPRRLFEQKGPRRARWTRRGSTLLIVRDGWIETLDVADPDAAPRPLFEAGGKLSRITFLRDGRRAAFQAGAGNEFWLLDLVTGERSRPAAALDDKGSWFQVLEEAGVVALFARTDRSKKEPADRPAEGEDKKAEKPPRTLHLVPLDGAGPIRRTSFEEGGRVEISPDGRFAVRVRRERDLGRRLVAVDFLAEHVETFEVRSSLPGDPGYDVTFELHDLEKDEPVPPPLDEGKTYWLAETSFAPVPPARLLVHRVSNDFHVRQILLVDPAARSSRLVWSERDDAWIGGPFLHASWLGRTGTILFTSERSGFNHLYLHDPERAATRPLTEPDGRFEVQAVWSNEAGDRVLALTNEVDPARRDLFAIDPKNGARRPITDRAGYVRRFEATPDGATVAFAWEFPVVPAELYAASTDDPKPVRLTETIPQALVDLELPPPEIVEYENPDDGRTVRALLYRPAGFEEGRKYPLVVFVHGAGYLQNVTAGMTAYDVNLLFHERLARKGYLVLDPDYRHSKGYGRTFRTDIYGYMGGKDLDDVVAGVRHLVEKGLADPDRVGIYGGSYGGFLTLMALFKKPDVFACGAALRSVTDWRTYNAWYTNARLGDPKENPENYKRSSPIDHAEGLEDPLLLLHGLKDRNVFAQDTIRLIEKLIELGKDFDAMLYPSQDHGFDDPDSWIDEYRRIERLFDRHLMPEPSGG